MFSQNAWRVVAIGSGLLIGSTRSIAAAELAGTGAGGAEAERSGSASPATTAVAIPATDPRFRYEGRFDSTDPKSPVIVWEASRVLLDFSGAALTLHFADITGQVCFDADVDGRKSLIDLREAISKPAVELSGFGGGRHQLALFKRTEASAGTVRFLGVTLGAGAQAWAPPKPHYATKMLFVGDSITVGACDEDGPEDQWQDRRTHNAAESYAALTAAAFDADYENISVSGMGIAMGWYDQLAGDVWNRLYPRASSPLADLEAWVPATVFVNLGENDDSYTTAKKLPFPAQYTSRYIELVHAIRRAYPKAEIVLLRGGMYGGAQSVRLRIPWQAAVTQLEATDPHIRHFVFTHWTHTHPRVVDHKAMAEELITALKK